MGSKALIWDLDGTLIDSYTVIVDCLAQVLAEQGVHLQKSDICRYVLRFSGQTLIEEVVAKLGLSAERLLKRNAELNEARALEIKPMPHAAEALKLLSRRHRNFIYTHKGASAERILQNLGIGGYFTQVVNGLAGFPRKPAPDAVLYLLDRYNIPPENAYYIGDRRIDVECAKNAGIKSILYLAHPNIVSATGSEDFTVRDLLEIADVVE